jgi:enoyl-CoA hydratase/carnithine racemase
MIDLSIHDRVARLVLSRPEAGNAVTVAMFDHLVAGLERAAAEADFLLITGAGADFTLGRDRAEKRTGPVFDAYRVVSRANAALDAFPGLVIAAVRGRAFGFGAGLVMRSDVAIAADDAVFALDEVKLGIPPMFIMEEILEYLPAKQAMDMIVSGREVPAAEALGMGLVSRVVAAARLEEEVENFLRELASRNRRALLVCKPYLRAVARLPKEARGAYGLVEATRYVLETR